MTLAQDIMELARWAPSGDNTQVWRFEFLDDARVRVHGWDTAEKFGVFDWGGLPSLLSLGCLILRPIATCSTCTLCAMQPSNPLHWRSASPSAACSADRCRRAR